MKISIKIVLVAIAIITTFTIQPQHSSAYPNPCLFTPEEFYQPDSVAIDTCTDSKTYKELFARRYFVFSTIYNIFNVDKVTPDTIRAFKWNDISSDYQILKNNFMSLEEEYCKYTIFQYRDTSLQRYRFYINFDEHIPIWNMVALLSSSEYNEYIQGVRWYGLVYNDIDEMNIENSVALKTLINDNILNIELSNPIIFSDNMYLYNQIGQCLQTINIDTQKSIYEIDVSGLSQGIYFVVYRDQAYLGTIVR